jgi:hypothetical protein
MELQFNTIHHHHYQHQGQYRYQHNKITIRFMLFVRVQIQRNYETTTLKNKKVQLQKKLRHYNGSARQWHAARCGAFNASTFATASTSAFAAATAVAASSPEEAWKNDHDESDLTLASKTIVEYGPGNVRH